MCLRQGQKERATKKDDEKEESRGQSHKTMLGKRVNVHCMIFKPMFGNEYLFETYKKKKNNNNNIKYNHDVVKVAPTKQEQQQQTHRDSTSLYIISSSQV